MNPTEKGPEVFSLVATGDSLIFQKISLFNEPEFLEVKEIISNADIAFNNFEALIRNEKGFPRYKMDVSGWMQNQRYVINELKWMGFNLFSLANNHSMDYSEEGLLENLRVFKEEQLTGAGTGRTLSEARNASYLNTQKGRVALIALNTRGEDGPASDPWKWIPGRPGVNPLRFIKTYHLQKEDFKLLSKISKKLDLTGNLDEKLDFLGHRFIKSDNNKISTIPYKPDFEGNINSIKNTKKYADFVFVSIHNHEKLRAGVTYFDDEIEYIAEFVETFSRAAVDAGADAILGHGTHCLNGIEIYQKRPIFYGLGNIISQMSEREQPYEWYEARNLHKKRYPDKKSANLYVDSERTRARARPILDPKLDQDAIERQNIRKTTSVIAKIIYQDKNATEILLYPIVLSRDTVQGGRPFMATKEEGHEILTRLNRLSKKYGTNIMIEENVGKIKI